MSPEPSTTCMSVGRAPLDARDLLGVEAELEDVIRLRRARELRVVDLVGVRPERGGRGDAHEKVRVPRPAGGVEEDGLVDDLGAGAHRFDRLRRRALGVPAPVGVADVDRRDVTPVSDELREVSRLVLLALALDQVALRVVDVRPLDARRAQTSRSSTVRCSHSRKLFSATEKGALTRTFPVSAFTYAADRTPTNDAAPLRPPCHFAPSFVTLPLLLVPRQNPHLLGTEVPITKHAELLKIGRRRISNFVLVGEFVAGTTGCDEIDEVVHPLLAVTELDRVHRDDVVDGEVKPTLVRFTERAAAVRAIVAAFSEDRQPVPMPTRSVAPRRGPKEASAAAAIAGENCLFRAVTHHSEMTPDPPAISSSSKPSVVKDRSQETRGGGMPDRSRCAPSCGRP